MIDEPEIERCVCGAEARMKSVIAADGTLYCVDVYWVRCSAPALLRQCWVGPLRPTRDEACAEWGTIMRAARERARLQELLHAEHDFWSAPWACTCPDCTEHRARVSATKETT